MELSAEAYTEIIRESAKYEKSLHEKIDFYKGEVVSKEQIINNMQETLNEYAKNLDKERRARAQAEAEVAELKEELRETRLTIADTTIENKELRSALEGDVKENVKTLLEELFNDFAGRLEEGAGE